MSKISDVESVSGTLVQRNTLFPFAVRPRIPQTDAIIVSLNGPKALFLNLITYSLGANFENTISYLPGKVWLEKKQKKKKKQKELTGVYNVRRRERV